MKKSLSAVALAALIACWSATAMAQAKAPRPRIGDICSVGFGGCCQSNRNSSPIDTAVPFSGKPHPMSDCHSARAAERRVL
jgi:hypothetical protein